MGAWGDGPFDSDGALDYLGGLADRVAEIDEEYEIRPGTVDDDKVRTELRAVLRGPQDHWDGDNVYAAAGLVAAALHPELVDRSSNTGTRLGEKFSGESTANLGLHGHCGYLTLIEADTALALREDALAGLQALKQNASWMGKWHNPQIGDLVDEVAALIESPSPTIKDASLT